MFRRICFFLATIFTSSFVFSQDKSANGILTGNVMDENKKALEGATVSIALFSAVKDSSTTTTDKDGFFSFTGIPFGYYRLSISYAGLQNLIIDSIYFREERSDFNMGDLTLRPKSSGNLGEVIIYAEKPLIESKDGNITFNASESALSAGSTASELLTNVPLVSKDPDGKITVRGKEPKILIDDKPVELNLQQLQDLLESMPGSSIEKIEVMTNPPPQYANEQGGVINIVTKKGKVGKSARINFSTGTRGDIALSGNYTYRKQGFALAVNGGTGYRRYEGNGYSYRNNIYADSSNYFNTRNTNNNNSIRPNLRINTDYDIDKYQSLNAVLQFNSSDYISNSKTAYENINRFDELYKLSERTIRNDGDSYNGSLSLSYLLKTKNFGEQLKVLFSGSFSRSNSDRNFYQQYFNPDHTFNGVDSTQEQLSTNRNAGYNVRADYSLPLKNRKTYLYFGSYYNRSNSKINADASYYRKSDSSFSPLDALSNNFRFHQDVVNLRASVKQLINTNLSVTAGLSAEQTSIWFELLKDNSEARNSYWTPLPFANINKRWNEKYNLTLAYRRSIRRPGINELNPTIDFSDPYNIRFGNEKLEASTSDNFDLVFGKTNSKYFFNFGLGYNAVKDIFSRVRTLLPDGKTQITWENISGRDEYEASAWGGLTLARKLRTSVSATYRFNQYSLFDRTYNRYRNGGSFTSNINANYTVKDTWSFIGSFNFNRFANPQGYARWNWSMNTGIQKKLFSKRLTMTLNIIDIFSKQRTKTFTYGTNFNLESYNSTNTKNIRFSIGYNLTKPAKKKVLNLPAKK